MHALINNRTRGLIVARNNASPAAVLSEMTAAFADFRTRNDGKIAGLQQGLDDMNAALSALKIGGSNGGDSPIASRAARQRAVQNLGKFGRTGRVEDLTTGLTVNAAMSTDNGPNGGYTVPEELSDELLTVQRNDSAMRRLARVVKTNSSVFTQPISISGVASGWVGEKESRPETATNTLAALEFPAMELYANPAITQNLLDDSAYDLGGFIASEIGDAFTEKEGSAFISGDGVAKPRGFLSYDIVSTADAARAFGKLQYTPSGVAGALSDGSNNGGDALITLLYSLKAKYRRNASWLMNSTTAAVIRKLKDTNGRYLWADSLVLGQPASLLGYPVEIDEDMSDIGANAYPVAFGDFKRGYLITDRVGMRILRDPLTNKPYVHFYATKRVGGGVLDSNAIKLLKVATS